MWVKSSVSLTLFLLGNIRCTCLLKFLAFPKSLLVCSIVLKKVKSGGVGIRQILARPSNSCMTFGKWFNLSSVSYKMRLRIGPTSRVTWEWKETRHLKSSWVPGARWDPDAYTLLFSLGHKHFSDFFFFYASLKLNFFYIFLLLNLELTFNIMVPVVPLLKLFGSRLQMNTSHVMDIL